jgi:hypothetical protein
MRQSIESLCGLPEKGSWPTLRRHTRVDAEFEDALERAKTARTAFDAAMAAVEAQAKKTAAAIIEYRARDYAIQPRQLDALETDPFQPRLSTLFPQQLRFRLAVLLGEELATPRRHIGLGGETIRLNLRAAIVYAERLCEIAEHGEHNER